MEFHNFTPYSALLGGILVGIAATLLMWLNGRIAGISGILGGLLPPEKGDTVWRFAFVVGLVVGGLGFAYGGGDLSSVVIEANTATLIGAGLLVGFGTRLGAGCTSGHGVCGIGRLSTRGIVSTITYIGVAMITVYITRHVLGS